MINEQDRGLVLYKSVEQSLAKPDQGPKSKIQAVVRLNSEVYSHFQIEEFLNKLNEKLFGGKGEVEPLSHSYSVSPSTQKDGQSRFDKLFSVTVDLNFVGSTSRLWVQSENLKIEKDKKSFDVLIIRIGQSMGIEKESYIFQTSGILVWKTPKNRAEGWGDSNKLVHLSSVSEGRLFSFHLNSVPPMEQISQALLQQVNEVLRELAAQGLIPELNQSASEEPIEQ